MLKDFKEVGKLGKPFGVHGMLRLDCSDQMQGVLANLKFVFLPRGGHYIPYPIEKIVDERDLLLKFRDINSPQDAKECSGNVLYLPAKDIPDLEPEDDGLFFSILRGFNLYNQDNEFIGVIKDIIEMPQQELALIAYKGEDVMIPMHESLIIEIVEETKHLSMELAEGLLP